jgi:hypothetical protein
VSDSLGNKAQVNVSVGGGLAISPADPAVPPRGKIPFEAVGGSGSFTWSLATSASGGTIDAASGAYVAGKNGNTTDVVVATDSLGNKASTQVTVGPGLTIAPVTSNVVAGAKIAFTAQGGSGTGYAFSFTTNASGATLTAAGVYVAGAQSGTDAIHLTDSLGNTADAKVTVTAAPTPPPFDAGTPTAPTFDAGTLPGLNLAGGGGNDDCACRAVGTGSGDAHAAAGSLAALTFALGLVVRRRRRS